RIPPEAEFPPLRYLSEAERQSARRLRLRHVLLLLLRTALIALIVLAAARPLVPAPAPATLRRTALHQRTALVVILDNSVSSGVVVDGRLMLDRLRAAARASLAAAGASDRLWLVLADGVARAGTREALLATLDSAGVSPRRRRARGRCAVAKLDGHSPHRVPRSRSRCRRGAPGGGWARPPSTRTSCERTIDACSLGGWRPRPASPRRAGRGRSWRRHWPCSSRASACDVAATW